jgi:hypothetical protein
MSSTARWANPLRISRRPTAYAASSTAFTFSMRRETPTIIQTVNDGPKFRAAMSCGLEPTDGSILTSNAATMCTVAIRPLEPARR